MMSRPFSSSTHTVNSVSTMRSSQELSFPALKKLYGTLVQQLKEYKRINTFLQNKVDSYQIGQEVNTLKAIINEQKAHITTLRDDNDRMAAVIRQQEKEIYQMNKDFNSTSFSSLQNEIKNLQTKTKRLQLYLKQKQVTERSLLSQIHALSKHNTDLMQLQEKPPEDSIDNLVNPSAESVEIEKLRYENRTLHKSVHRFREMVYSLQRELRKSKDEDSSKGNAPHILENSLKQIEVAYL